MQVTPKVIGNAMSFWVEVSLPSTRYPLFPSLLCQFGGKDHFQAVAPLRGIGRKQLVKNFRYPLWFRLGGNQVTHPSRWEHMASTGTMVVKQNEAFMKSVVFARDVG